MTANEIELARAAVNRAKKMVVLTGAGMSAESGVPTFRGGGGADIWRGMPFTTLSSAEMVKKDLPLVWEWFDHRRSVLAHCKPNSGHLAVAEAQQSGRFDAFTVVTQNIDDLHHEAGSADVVELHGNIHHARCLSCGGVDRLQDVAERPPVCRSCSGKMRPNVVLFGEMLDEEVMGSAVEAVEACDVCLVVGTSALVSPANLMPMYARRNGAAIIEVNPEETSLSSITDLSIRGYSSKVLPQIFRV